jgi:phosphohistidine swiveling domain-containing protein
MIQEKHKWILEELKDLRAKGLISKPRKRSGKGYARFPIKWSIEGNFKGYGIEEVGVVHKAYAAYSVGDLGGIILIDMETREKAKQNQLKKALEFPEYISHRKYLTDKYGNMLLYFCLNKLSKENIQNASKQELWELYNQFRDIYIKYEFYNGIWFIISDDYLKEIMKRLDKYNLGFNEAEIISTCSIQTFTNREKVALLTTAKKIIDNYKAKALIEQNNFEEFKKILEFSFLKELADEYCWIPFGHVGPELFDERYYFNQIRKLIEEGKNIDEELEEAENFYPGIRGKQKEIYEKYNIDEETIEMIRNFHLLCIMQDDRKELISKSHINWVNNLMGKIGSFFGYTPLQAADLYPKEIENALLHDIINSELTEAENSSERKVSITEPDGYTTYFDEDAQEFLDVIIGKETKSEILGMIACQGYAKGRVKVLADANEGHKMEKGDILVTTMTTPDFLPYMEKAAAIITDEGGVTCHAAIVSREFGIPCIVGTENATEVLKDGDIVEVDAVKGIVRKI